MTENIENVVLQNLVTNEEFARQVIPFVKSEYFQSPEGKVLFDEVTMFIEQYKKLPSIQALEVQMNAKDGFSDEQFQGVIDTLEGFKGKTLDNETSTTWLIDQTEAWCQQRAVYNAIMDSIAIMDGNDKKSRTQMIIPELLSNALAVNFDNSVGHDFIKDADKRWEYYHSETKKLAFDIDILNQITGGGLKPATLNMFFATTGGGKSAIMSHLAASYLAQGKNVLYISLEMGSEEIAQRIDANLMQITMDEVVQLSKKDYLSKIVGFHKAFHGNLVIKDLPGGVTHAGHIRHVLRELELKKRTKPDVLIVDYLSIAASSRFKTGGVNQSYYIKAVAEELRGLGQEFKIPVISAAQYNREGMGSSDAEITDVAESIGITHTADLILGIIRTEELDNMNQVMLKQLKNRYNATTKFKRFVIGMDLSQSRYYDLNDSAQENIMDDSPPLMDRKFGPEPTGKGGKNKKPRDFTGFKVQ